MNYLTAPIDARIDKNVALLNKMKEAGVITGDAFDDVETYFDNKKA